MSITGVSGNSVFETTSELPLRVDVVLSLQRENGIYSIINSSFFHD